jgi:hypothetical protein
MLPWALRLIDEAGCDPFHYLFFNPNPPCFYVRAPEEFVANLVQPWFASSKDVLRLAVQRFRQGNPHPLNQAVFLLATFGTNRVNTWNSRGSSYGAIWAYEYDAAYHAPMVEIWQAFPWRCGGPAQITGPDFSLGLTTDATCHVTAITHAEEL